MKKPKGRRNVPSVKFHHRSIKSLLIAGCRSGTTRLSTRIGWTAGLNWNSAADRARNAANLGFRDLAGNAGCLRHHACLANLTAGGVRNLTGPNFLGHRAGGVRNLLGDCFAGPRAGRVRNLLGNRFAGPRAGRVRNLLGDRFAGPRAGGVRNLLGDALLFVANTGVRNLLHTGDWNSTADRVRLLAVTDFLNHTGAADRSHFRSRNPATAADRTVGLAATGAGAVIASRRVAGLGANGARDLLRFGDPITCANFNLA